MEILDKQSLAFNINSYFYNLMDGNFDFTNFKKDKTKLSKYYESIGFKELDKKILFNLNYIFIYN